MYLIQCKRCWENSFQLILSELVQRHIYITKHTLRETEENYDRRARMQYTWVGGRAGVTTVNFGFQSRGFVIHEPHKGLIASGLLPA